MARDLTNRVIVITGASAGIGAAVARACAAAGMDVVISGRRAERLDALAAEVRQRGRVAECVAGDVTDAGFSGRLLEAAERRFGRFDTVFANAGYGFFRSMHELSADELRRIFDVNLFAACELLSEAARRLIARQQPGHLLMTSSVASRFALPHFGAYSATKGAQSLICQAMRGELKPYRIMVSSVHPSTTSSEFFEQADQITRRLGQNAPAIPDRPAWLSQTAEQVADAVLGCLRRPRAEVWPLGWLRYATAMLMMFPRLADRLGAERRRS